MLILQNIAKKLRGVTLIPFDDLENTKHDYFNLFENSKPLHMQFLVPSFNYSVNCYPTTPKLNLSSVAFYA